MYYHWHYILAGRCTRNLSKHSSFTSSNNGVILYCKCKLCSSNKYSACYSRSSYNSPQDFWLNLTTFNTNGMYTIIIWTSKQIVFFTGIWEIYSPPPTERWLSSCYAILYSDDTSGNKSKQWNKFDSWSAKLASLPNEMNRKLDYTYISN